MTGFAIASPMAAFAQQTLAHGAAKVRFPPSETDAAPFRKEKYGPDRTLAAYCIIYCLGLVRHLPRFDGKKTHAVLFNHQSRALGETGCQLGSDSNPTVCLTPWRAAEHQAAAIQFRP